MQGKDMTRYQTQRKNVNEQNGMEKRDVHSAMFFSLFIKPFKKIPMVRGKWA